MNLFSFFFFTIILFEKNFSVPICIESKNHCSKCNLLTNLCVICDKKDILIPDNNGGCIGSKKCMIGQNYCKECNELGDACKLCQEGYFPDDNGGCCHSYNCKLSYKGECFECEDNYILLEGSYLKICKSLLSEDFKNCKEIDIYKGVCQICGEGYFLSEGDRRCTKTENCLETIFGNCISCNEMFYLDKREGMCINKTDTEFLFCKQTLDGQNCDICDDGLYLDENQMCSFSNFCSESLDGNCRKCILGYYLAKNNFCSNIENCVLADKDTGICLLCEENYYLDDKDYKCKSNLEDNEFKYCSKVENNICTSCTKNHYLGQDKKCSSTKNCEESENGICILCSKNYYLGKDNYCSDIEHCIYTGYSGKCLECEDGYYYNDKYKECYEYSYGDIYYGCKYANIFSDCIECKDMFYSRANDSACLDNTQEGPFYKCKYSDNEGEFCELCIDGYYLGSEDKKCILIENCKISENEKKCLQCDDFYCLDVKRQKCIENNILENPDIKIYFACKRTNDEGTACEECIEGYEVNEEGFCIDAEYCIERENEKCIKCKNKINNDGYISKYFCANDIFGCVETSDITCEKCNFFEKKFACTKCIEGYILNSFGNCIKKQKE